MNDKVLKISGLYDNWFLDYASYVILERAIPSIEDGFKPVQRRIIHSMKSVDDGRYNKVANIIGHTMQYHPHGDTSIGGALVSIGQKDYLVDCQGNWGNIFTGDGAAAPRYIEARLSKFALDTIFSPKITKWGNSYDGRNKEPIAFPTKFPILLLQGAEGIAVGLTSKTFSHNFNELCDASVSYLKNKPFELYPDFQTGGILDASNYNDGQRGGVLKIRAKIEKVSDKLICIKEIPFGTCTEAVISSIIKEIEKGRLKIKNINDLTSFEVNIELHLQPGVSAEDTIEALYALTACEQNLYPNLCVIKDNKPYFTNVSDVLRYNTDKTKEYIKEELLIKKTELNEQLFNFSLEAFFIENALYKNKEFESAKDIESVLNFLRKAYQKPIKNLYREISDEDLKKLLEIKMNKILKFNKEKFENDIQNLISEISKIDDKLNNLVKETIKWFEELKKKYGKSFERKTELSSFKKADVSQIITAKNEKIYINRKDGFIGTSLKKDELLCECSDLDDILIILKNGNYKITKVSDKVFVGKDILYAGIYRKDFVFNFIYTCNNQTYLKRVYLTGLTKDKEYTLVNNEINSILYLDFHKDSEINKTKIRIYSPIASKLKFAYYDIILNDYNVIKSRQAYGNSILKAEVDKIHIL